MPGKSLRELRARAHSLKPVVWISGNGATETVLREIDRSLQAHELIKIHAAVDGRAERESLMAHICGGLSAQAVQIIGKMLVVFRARPEATPPEPHREKSAPAKRAAKSRSPRTFAPNSRRPAAGPGKSSARKR